jgi:hypothetical protein
MRRVLAAVLGVVTVGSLLAQPQGTVLKQRLTAGLAGTNLLKGAAWTAWEQGFALDGGMIVCDNGADAAARRGAGQAVALNQTQPAPIFAVAWSRAEGVTGTCDIDYSLYLDMVFTDGEPRWGEISSFTTGTHGWEKRQVLFVPEKPLRSVSLYVLLRGHGGKAWFKEVSLRQLEVPEGTLTFDGVPVRLVQPQTESGFQVRDVAAEGDILAFDQGQAAGLRLSRTDSRENGASFVQAEVRDLTGRDRAITLCYAVRIPPGTWSWLADPRSAEPVQGQREVAATTRFAAGAAGRLSPYPFGAVADGKRGVALAVDLFTPVFSRVGYNAGTQELFVACDVALTPECPAATLRFCTYDFDGEWGFRGALAALYRIFPDAFRKRQPEQGLWMPFAKISAVQGWEDFGFKFKEGNDETAWDDAHGIITFRYTEPLTWWMPMAADTPWTIASAVALAKGAAATEPDSDKGRTARALLSSGYHDENGQFVALFQQTPWCNGAVWSMNSMPGITADVTDFTLKWNDSLKQSLYGPQRQGDLDGEYVDSSEGYVTAVLNYRRDHFAAARTPLTFDLDSRRPALFRALLAAEYVRALAEDVHGMGKLMMANATPDRVWFLAPNLDVMGTETDWNPGGTWRPMAHRDLLYRRALCGPKPYCFLMNTDFAKLPAEKVEKYMKRSLAYGMFPGFFSADAASGHYFSRPELYNRDRPLFRKYVPLCKRVAEAGWQPVTQARANAPAILVERFGDDYLTVFNDGAETADVVVRILLPAVTGATDLVSGAETQVTRDETGATAAFRLAPEDVAVLHLRR